MTIPGSFEAIVAKLSEEPNDKILSNEAMEITDQTLNFFKMSPAASLDINQIDSIIDVFTNWTIKHLVVLAAKAANPTKPAMEDSEVKSFF
jgi:hypothetical protein